MNNNKTGGKFFCGKVMLKDLNDTEAKVRHHIYINFKVRNI